MPRKTTSPDQQPSASLHDTPDSSAPAPDAVARPAPKVAAPRHATNFPIVGIGASAGGLAAFEAFFRHMPAETDRGIAFVLVQHLAPDHTSLLGELIQRFTRMRVSEVEDGMFVERNHVYIIPPNADLSLFHGRLHLLEPSAPKGIPLPIDHFFRSLAQEKRDAAIAIVLSGAGSDGTLGVRAVKEAGGMVMVQAPASAEYDSMPTHAIATGLVDYILPPEEMPAQLLAFVQHATQIRAPEAVSPSDKDGEALQKIFLLLRAQTRHDFSDYKLNTVLRRIERRMVIHQFDNLAAYVHYLQQTPSEVIILFRELLIGVTRFFREPEAFNAVKTQVMPLLFDEKSTGDSVRVWVPGCSTGEEAYSLAMLFHEFASARHPEIKVQLFATDIDSVAIETARLGVYPRNIVADVPAEYLGRYFIQEEQNYRINKIIRDMVVFAEQDLILDPPFSHMDFISCRNLLIYLNADLQKKLLPLFHYALNPNGFLFLGSSETIGDFTDLFTASNRKWKLYQRQEAVTPYRVMQNLQPQRARVNASQGLASREARPNDPQRLRTIMEQNLLARYTSPSVLINKDGEVLFVHGSTGRYLEPASGEANFNILRMARPGIRVELATAVRKAVMQQEAVHLEGLPMQVDDRVQTVNLLVSPVTSPMAPGLYLVVFED
ncbi:MAG TPA: chemotaxis protein CheB, partial [Armatimonadota bacterium]